MFLIVCLSSQVLKKIGIQAGQQTTFWSNWYFHKAKLHAEGNSGKQAAVKHILCVGACQPLEYVLEEVLPLDKFFKTRLVDATPHTAGGNPATTHWHIFHCNIYCSSTVMLLFALVPWLQKQTPSEEQEQVHKPGYHSSACWNRSCIPDKVYRKRSCAGNCPCQRSEKRCGGSRWPAKPERTHCSTKSIPISYLGSCLLSL